MNLLLWYILLRACLVGVYAGTIRSNGLVHYSLGNGTDTIPTDIPSDVTVVTLDGNQLVQVDTFGVFTALTNVRMNNNLLVEFPNFSSIGASLLTLELKYNKIASIDPARLTALTALTMLHLMSNQLTNVPDVTNTSPSLKTIMLDSNYLTALPDLPNLGKNLNSLGVNTNRLTSLGTDSLARLVSLGGIDAQNNQLTDFPDMLPISDTLTSLILSSNTVTRIPVGKLNSLQMIFYFYMNKCGLVHMPDFSGSPSRDTLAMLMLMDNAITSIPAHTVSTLTSLSTLYLTNNPLTTMPNFCHLPQTLYLDMRVSTLRCDCHLRWLKRFELMGSFILSSSQTMPCAEPPELVGVRWTDISLEQLTCDGE